MRYIDWAGYLWGGFEGEERVESKVAMKHFIEPTILYMKLENERLTILKIVFNKIVELLLIPFLDLTYFA